jgi:cysteinyl-tRNA synthetase
MALVTLRLYDTLSRTVRDFEPLHAGRVGMYLCGDTVYGEPHIGHARSKVIFDVLWRWLERSGYQVWLVRNITDVDDKIIRTAAAEGVPWWLVAQREIYATYDAYRLLGCRPPSMEPLATGHIPEMHQLIERLISRGHAYAADGDVYFAVRSLPGYGELSHQRLEHVQQGESAATGKRDPADFTLWKAAKEGEPAWPSPWGNGRPGWHLECSAMATKYLGGTFDIHGGGVDLVFPHHENELAQSRGAGDGFARYWLHNGMLNLRGEKMSKSLGNTLLVRELAQQLDPAVIRYYLLSAHYRSAMEYGEDSLTEAGAAYERLKRFVVHAAELVGADAGQPTLCADFVTAMNDDLSVPRALAAVHEVVREGNTALSNSDRTAVAGALGSVRAMLQVLGLDPLSEQWSQRVAGGDLRPVVDRLVEVALAERQAARERRDYAAADRIRDELARAGIVVEDTAAGPRWSLGEGT